MKEEIAVAVVFITRLVKKNEKFSKQKIEKFGNKLTKILFEKYKNHWYWGNPPKGQAYRCIRVNKNQPRDPVLFQACVESNIEYSSLELPKELTIWVDPYEVWCRCGEKNQPFIVTKLEEQNSNLEIFMHISNAAERATSDYFSGTSSDEEGCNKELNTTCAISSALGEEESFTTAIETKTIPIVSNPNSIYQVEDFGGGGIPGEEPQTIPTVINPKSIYQYDYYTHPAAGWPRSFRKKSFVEDCNGYYPPQKIYKMYRVSNMFTVPHIDRYHWVNMKR
ncbi:protein BTG4 [Pristis pectinata]|uniref:protein BTG4 n=1 Tax=Pristis pectinata TaxID=685728 RepID=UPI00223E4D0F|nr:protein BTG4 [Pristis pectinata]